MISVNRTTPNKNSRGGLSPFHDMVLLHFPCELMPTIQLSFDESEEQVIQILSSYIIPTEFLVSSVRHRTSWVCWARSSERSWATDLLPTARSNSCPSLVGRWFHTQSSMIAVHVAGVAQRFSAVYDGMGWRCYLDERSGGTPSPSSGPSVRSLWGYCDQMMTAGP